MPCKVLEAFPGVVTFGRYSTAVLLFPDKVFSFPVDFLISNKMVFWKVFSCGITRNIMYVWSSDSTSCSISKISRIPKLDVVVLKVVKPSSDVWRIVHDSCFPILRHDIEQESGCSPVKLSNFFSFPSQGWIPDVSLTKSEDYPCIPSKFFLSLLLNGRLLALPGVVWFPSLVCVPVCLFSNFVCTLVWLV